MVDATCSVCDGHFLRRSVSHKYCSKRCRELAKNAPDRSGRSCVVCGGHMHRGPGMLPQGEAAHRRCKPELHGVARYGRGCRCEVCTVANREAARAYRKRTNYYSLSEVRTRRKAYYSDPERRARYRAVERIGEARRQAALRAAPTTNFTPDDLAARLSMFAGCWICGCDLSEGMHVDHVKPLSRGGAHMLSNLRPACPTCNIRKGAIWPFRALPKLPVKAG